MRRISMLVFIVGASVTIAQVPAPMPPQPLPSSITGQPSTTNSTAVRPTSGQMQTAVVPMMRFTQNLAQYPPETVQAVYSLRASADWLWRMNQANGRFFYGLNPSVRRALDGDNDLHQAIAAVALAEAAAFTGDDRLTARATQALLSQLAQLKQEPITATDKTQRVGLMACTAVGLYTLPGAEPRLQAEAKALVNQLRARFDASGRLLVVDDGITPDAVTATLAPGYVLQALAKSYQVKPESWKKDCIANYSALAVKSLKSQFHAVVAASLLPGLVELTVACNNDAQLAALALDLADRLGDCQYGRAEPPPVGWFGGFKPQSNSIAEPTSESCLITMGLASALKLTRQLPDANRYAKYRVQVVDGLNFGRSLQFSEENCDHFEKAFRAKFLLGGVHLRPSDGTVRIDATAQLLMATLKFLNSGAETGN